MSDLSLIAEHRQDFADLMAHVLPAVRRHVERDCRRHATRVFMWAGRYALPVLDLTLGPYRYGRRVAFHDGRRWRSLVDMALRRQAKRKAG